MHERRKERKERKKNREWFHLVLWLQLHIRNGIAIDGRKRITNGRKGMERRRDSSRGGRKRKKRRNIHPLVSSRNCIQCMLCTGTSMFLMLQLKTTHEKKKIKIKMNNTKEKIGKTIINWETSAQTKTFIHSCVHNPSCCCWVCIHTDTYL
jgi:hypothetical protein